MSEQFSNATSLRLMEHAATLDLEDFEDSELQDRLDRARRQTIGRNTLLGQVFGQAQDIITRVGVKAGGPDAPAQSLSGGNLQKFIVGREISAGPSLLIVSQPTWGVDVGAAQQIRSEILALRDAGCAVLVLSEELDELFDLCDRLYVMAKGHLSPSVDRADATAPRIGEWMSGLWHADVQAHLARNREQLAALTQGVPHVPT